MIDIYSRLSELRFASASLNSGSGVRLSRVAVGTAALVSLSLGCTQDYDISSIDADEDIAAAPVMAAPSAGSPVADDGVVSGSAIADGSGSAEGHAIPQAGGRAFDHGLYNYSPVEAGGDAVESLEDPENREREDSYEIDPGMRTSVVDFLFVVDNSTSMGRIRDLVRSGLVSLYDDDPFPADARIAVMSTIPANPADLNQLHPRVNNQGGQEFEPGFLRLVNANGIERFRKESPELAGNFQFDGCDAWFEPWEENDQGVPCMVAHTQISRTPVRVEAGLSAFQQFLQKRAGKPTFREGAAVHVIFVSDTHSPGLAGGPNRLRKTGLEVEPITFGNLQGLVDADNMVSSFKVHAIAPATECVEEWAYLGPRYFNVAEASGGVTLDICTAEDYSSFIRDLVEDSDLIEAPIVSLGRAASELHEVVVDGKIVDFDVVGEGSAVRVKGLNVADPQRITVRYRY